MIGYDIPCSHTDTQTNIHTHRAVFLYLHVCSFLDLSLFPTIKSSSVWIKQWHKGVEDDDAVAHTTSSPPTDCSPPPFPQSLFSWLLPHFSQPHALSFSSSSLPHFLAISSSILQSVYLSSYFFISFLKQRISSPPPPTHPDFFLLILFLMPSPVALCNCRLTENGWHIL